MHAQQLGPAAAAAAAAGHPPLPMLPHPGLAGAPGLPPSSAASLLGLSALGGAPHPLAMLNAKHDLHRDDKTPGQESIYITFIFPILMSKRSKHHYMILIFAALGSALDDRHSNKVQNFSFPFSEFFFTFKCIQFSPNLFFPPINPIPFPFSHA